MGEDDKTADESTSEPTGPREGQQQGWLTTRRRIAVAVVLLAVVGIALAVLNQVIKTKKTVETVFPEPITSIDIDVMSGNIDVTEVDDRSTVIEHTMVYVLRKPAVSQKVEDGVLKIRSECKGLNVGECRADFHLVIPHNVPVKAVTDAGSVDVLGAKVDLDVTTTSGDVLLDSTYGRLIVRTDSGSVKAPSSSSQDITIGTNSGHIDFQASSMVSKVDLSSSSGNVQMTVGKSNTKYVVDATSENGKTTVQIPRDAASPFTIKAHSATGDVTVRQR